MGTMGISSHCHFTHWRGKIVHDTKEMMYTAGKKIPGFSVQRYMEQ